MATTIIGQTTKATARRYTFFNPKLRDGLYDIGDIYGIGDVEDSQQEWDIINDKPYLTHVKSLSNSWPHLRLLSDFMEVSTTPARWKDFQKKTKESEDERDKRARKTNVTQLDYLNSGEVISNDYRTSEDLRKALNNEINNDKAQLRLFVVEDLSRDVIELLGAHLDIEPEFFREHIVDYAWYNTRDRWVNPPNLDMVAKRQHWLQLRYVTTRYFKTTESFEKGREQAESFNVLRRLDDDQNSSARWDEEGAIVGITRTKASFWFKHAKAQEKQAVGVLLLDPTIKAGFPLWRFYRNWETTTGIDAKETRPGPPQESIFEDFIYWAQRPQIFKSSSLNGPASNIHIPIQALLHLICAEWLKMADYIKTRLSQIDWEITFPEHFLDKRSDIDVPLKKLHIWRRLVPLYREMLTETLQRDFRFPCHIISRDSDLSSTSNSFNCDRTTVDPASAQEGSINEFRADFTRVLSCMEEYQQRIGGLTSVVTAVITIADSRRGLDENRNVARLTWLATFFIPLSFMASLFSMQEDISKLRETFKWYFAAALPLTVISLALVATLTLPSVQKLGRRTKNVQN